MTVKELMAAFSVNNDKDLGAIFDRTNKAVSKWRKVGVPASIERRAHEILLTTPASAPPETPSEPPNELLRYFGALSDTGKQRVITMAKGILLKELQDEKDS